MTVEVVRDALAWCTVMNLVILFLWGFLIMLAPNWVHRMHGKFIDVPVDQFKTIHYGAMAAFKMGIILFNLVPSVT